VVESGLRMSYFDPGISTWSEMASWRYSLIPLAVDRGRPLLRVAALPDAICEDASALVMGTREILHRLDQVANESALGGVGDERWWSDDIQAGVNAVLTNGLSGLSGTYGVDATLDLTHWLRRNEVVWSERQRWWEWWLYLSGIGRKRVPAPSRADGWLRRILVDPGFTAQVEATIEDAQREAAAIPISPGEGALLAYEVSTDEPEPGSLDVVGQLTLAAYREAARGLHGILSASTPNDEWQAMQEDFARFKT
jgi:hypothetical protein